MSSNNYNTTNALAAPSNNASYDEMTLLSLQLRMLRQSKRISVPSPVTTSTSNGCQEHGSTVPSRGIGSNIPVLLQRRSRCHDAQGRLPRVHLVRLMDEALCISTNLIEALPPQQKAIPRPKGGSH